MMIPNIKELRVQRGDFTARKLFPSTLPQPFFMFPVYPDQPRPLLDLNKYLIVLTDANYVSTDENRYDLKFCT